MRHAAPLTALALTATAGLAQTTVNATYTGSFNGSYTSASSWSIGAVPNNTADTSYNITLNLPTRILTGAGIAVSGFSAGSFGAVELDAPATFTVLGPVTGLGTLRTRDPGAVINVAAAGHVDHGRFESFDGGITVSAASWSTTLAGEVLAAKRSAGSAVISMPSLASITLAQPATATAFGATFADGNEARLDLPALASVSGDMTWYATFGGVINAGSLASLDSDTVTAERAGSLILMDAATTASGATLQSLSGATLSLGALTSADGALLRAHGQGSVLAADSLTTQPASNTRVVATGGGSVWLNAVDGAQALSIDQSSQLSVSGGVVLNTANAESLDGSLVMTGDGTLEIAQTDEADARLDFSMRLTVAQNATVTLTDATDDDNDGLPDALYLSSADFVNQALALEPGATLEVTPGQPIYLLDNFAWVRLEDLLAASEGCVSFDRGQICFVTEQEEEPEKPACLADVNPDGVLDHGDILAFVRLYIDRDPGADLDGNLRIGPNDVRVFLRAFLTGCQETETTRRNRGIGRVMRYHANPDKNGRENDSRNSAREKNTKRRR
ncbi:MAG: GC-type dockerin domain-anchored protein [Phycisphaerales bacterium JB040]